MAGAVTVVSDACQLLKQLLERQGRVHHDRLHVGEIFEVRIEVDRIEDAEGLLADFVAKPRRAPEHLFVKDAAVDPTEEDQVGNARHVDAGREQVHGDGDLRQGVVAIGADQGPHAIDAAGHLADGRVFDLAIAGLHGLLDLVRRRCRHGRR